MTWREFRQLRRFAKAAYRAMVRLDKRSLYANTLTKDGHPYCVVVVARGIRGAQLTEFYETTLLEDAPE